MESWSLPNSEALQRPLAANPTLRFPATFLWLHPRVTLLCDNAAMD